MSTISGGPARPLTEMPVYREGATDSDSFDALQSDPAMFLLRGYRKAGAVYRTPFRSGEWVVIGGIEANDFAWRNGARLWSYAIANAPFREELGPDHVSILDGDAHRKGRVELKPAFDQEPSMRYLPQFNQSVVEVLRNALGEKRIEFNTFWAEAITRHNAQTAAQYPFPDDVIRRMALYESMLLKGLFLEDARDQFVGAEDYRTVKAVVMDWIGRLVDERIASPGKVQDHIDRVIAAGLGNGNGAPDRQKLVTYAYFILAAGVHNTANLAAWTFRFVHRFPEWKRALREEVDAWDGGDAMRIAGMPRLKATVMETLRLRPGFPWFGQHAKAAFTFGGYEIPEGTQVLHAINLCQFLEEYYPEPLSFNPQRFIDLGGFNPKTFGVFGGGTHICIGRHHSLMQAPIILAQLLKHYDLELHDDSQVGTGVDYSGIRVDSELWGNLVARR